MHGVWMGDMPTNTKRILPLYCMFYALLIKKPYYIHQQFESQVDKISKKYIDYWKVNDFYKYY